MILSTELPAEFSKPLTDVQTYEKESATLECELTKPNKQVKWLRNKKPVKETSKIKIIADDKVHKLEFTDITLKEEGKYSCVCGDVTTSATLTVGGKQLQTLSNYFSSPNMMPQFVLLLAV